MPQQSTVLDVNLRSASPNAQASTPLKLTAELTERSSSESRLVATSFTTQITPNVSLPLSFVTPHKDGVYEILLNVEHEPQVRAGIPIKVSVYNTTVRHQFVVSGAQVLPRLTGNWTLTDRRILVPEYRLKDESSVDSPSRRLFRQLPLPPFPSLPKVAELPRITDLPKPTELLRLPRPFSRQNSASTASEMETDISHFPLGFLRFSASTRLALIQSEQHSHFSALPSAGTNGLAWHSLMMDTEIGKPYLVEIDYPSNVPQTFGVGIFEGFSPREEHGDWSGIVNVAANIHVADNIVRDTPVETVATHQILFWAKSEHPELVLVNRQAQQEALFRNIRISRVVLPSQQEDQRLPKLFEGTAQRKRIGQIQQSDIFPNLMDTGGSMDWQLLHEGCSRLLDTLSRGGYDGVTLTVLSRMSAPRVNGMLNGLEMMFRRFNSEGLTLIPAIEFDMPIPSLERWLKQYPATAEEICIGDPALHHYNLLSPIVQRAMAGIVLELVDRFGHHPSFGGVAIVLSPDSYAQLPFALYPPDDLTFVQFQQETAETLGVSFPEEQFSAQKNAARLQFLHSKPVWETWVCWRAAKVSRFYADLAKQLSEKRNDAPLYILGGTMLDQPEIQQFCAPTLPRNFTALQTIQLLGFDLPLISQTESLHFLKPVHIADASNRGRNHSYDGLDYTDTTPLFFNSGMLAGVQFVHNDYDYFVTTPAHLQSRRRFVQQLAQADVLMFMDAGVTLPVGQEPAQFDLLDTYRRLPPVPFQTFQHLENQPLTIRYYNSPDGMIMYIVNGASFSVEADFVFTADSECRLAELTGHRMIRSLGKNSQRPDSYTWRASLLPYDLLAIRINDANAKIESLVTHCPPSVEEALRQRIEGLAQRVHAARRGVQWDGLMNADFELGVFDMIFKHNDPVVRKLSDTEAIIPGWQRYGNSLTTQVDRTVASKGECSVKLTSSSAEPGMFLSDPLALPITGRLDVSMFVGVPADARSLPISVVFSAKHRGEPFLRTAPVGETLMPLLAKVEPKNGVRWHPVRVSFQLPLESLEEVRVGVQHSDSGMVWIDDITLYHVAFSPNEIAELLKQLPVADQRCSSGRVSELLTFLESYWAQFLFEHVPVPLPAVAVARTPVAKEVVVPPPPSVYQRMRGWFGR